MTLRGFQATAGRVKLSDLSRQAPWAEERALGRILSHQYWRASPRRNTVPLLPNKSQKARPKKIRLFPNNLTVSQNEAQGHLWEYENTQHPTRQNSSCLDPPSRCVEKQENMAHKEGKTMTRSRFRTDAEVRIIRQARYHSFITVPHNFEKLSGDREDNF